MSTTAPKATKITPKFVSKMAASKLPNAKITPRRASARGHADHGWLNSYHTFSFASYYDPRFLSFGALRVLNEDRVSAGTGFPTHPHRDAEIFSYILSGELTHRDSMVKQTDGSEVSKEDFYRMKRGDVQFTTGGTGIAHSEQNEHERDEVHFLQIWATPWRKGLPPTYHTSTFSEADKLNKFATIISPLKAGIKATKEEEKAAVPVVEGTIPVHADLLMAASIVEKGESVTWTVGGGNAVSSKEDRKIYVHVPMRMRGAVVKLNSGDRLLDEGDGAFIEGVNAGDELVVQSVGDAEAELVVLDSN